MAILLPSLQAARQSALATNSLSNLRQIGIALTQYRIEHRGFYPRHSSPSSTVPRTRWVDDIYRYLRHTEIYMSPLLFEDERIRMNKPFAHTVDPGSGAILPSTKFFGGYGYNYQYLGNARVFPGVLPFHANERMIRASSQTIAISDTNGSKDGGTIWTSEAVYAIDPPLQSIELGSRGSRFASANPHDANNYSYRGGSNGDASRRATPAERNRGRVNVLFCDGHARAMTLREMDDFNGDGLPDNGWWNGKADPNRR